MKEHFRTRQLSPINSITIITEVGPADCQAGEISPEQIGLKAYGLASLPSEWVPPFFVITASCFEGSHSNEIINGWVTECLACIGIGKGVQVMVRSSGTSETTRNRGLLKSRPCSQNQIVAEIRDLIEQLAHIPGSKIHWIVQEYANTKEKGHLSNERRLRLEKRDWVAEFEPQGHKLGYTVPIAVRAWRDGTPPADFDLPCTSEFEITPRLKRVAMWATQFSLRIHFEWVWDGKSVHIVQADVSEPAVGVNPQSLIKNAIPSVEFASLQLFYQANQENYKRYVKLRNVRLYGELGYKMPVFYVLDDYEIVHNILSGLIPLALEGDLAELTKRPLIIRTDGDDVPYEKREMLPRSGELRSYTEARDWLLNCFKSEIEQSGLGSSKICLIAHHFIPSVASAWARAEPDNRIVRVESLWGIPEGLYWYSHDTFEVDTQNVYVGFEPLTAPLKYKYLKHLRYKGTFIAPDENGKWIPNQTNKPFDWNMSISNEEWLFEIARTTKQVAEREKHAVAVMWFIDNHPEATTHHVLPWFHNKSELAGSPKAAPRHKRKSASDFIIKNVSDWQKLQQESCSGSYIERVVVEPVDPELIRNPQFAEGLAELASSKKFVVELSGGILSHAYYILQRYGAQVECVDLFGANEDVIEYNKIVRDKVPSLIEGRGEGVETLKIEGDALIAALRQKLVEEAFEALDTKSGEELIGELADIQEVVIALCRAMKVSITDIEEERKDKEESRGGFEKGLMLIKTTTPHSIYKQSNTPDTLTLGLRMQPSSEPHISEVSKLPTKPVYRRPDLRQVNQELEKLFTFEIEANKIGEIKEYLNFSMPMEDQSKQNFTLTVELKRIRSSVRGIVRLHLHRLLQLQFDFIK